MRLYKINTDRYNLRTINSLTVNKFMVIKIQ